MTQPSAVGRRQVAGRATHVAEARTRTSTSPAAVTRTTTFVDAHPHDFGRALDEALLTDDLPYPPVAARPNGPQGRQSGLDERSLGAAGFVEWGVGQGDEADAGVAQPLLVGRGGQPRLVEERVETAVELALPAA